MAFTMETHVRVYDDSDGSFVEVRPDTDGLDLVEINCPQSNARLVMPTEWARLVAKAIVKVADALDAPAQE